MKNASPLRTTVLGVVLLALPACSRSVPEEQPTDGGRVDSGPTDAPPYPRVSVGTQTSCSIDRTGRLACWGAFATTHHKPPEGVWADLSFSGVGCAISPLGTLGCWGSKQGPAHPAFIPEGRFRKVSVASHACAIRVDGKIVCWGSPYDGKSDAPEGQFQDVSAGSNHSCALRADGTAVCWGKNQLGQCDAPEGVFASISAGNSISCAVRPNMTVECWGAIVGFTPPTGSDALAVSVGYRGTCVIRRNRSLECFGDDVIAHPPAGQFAQVSLGAVHGCAVRMDGTIACWGVNTDGQATPP